MRANLIELADIAKSGSPLPDNLARWLADGIARHLQGEPLESCLGLNRHATLKLRNAALYDAWLMLDEPNDWAKARALAGAIKRFRAAWPSLAKRRSHSFSPLEEALHRAFASGQKIPSTPRQLWNLLK